MSSVLEREEEASGGNDPEGAREDMTTLYVRARVSDERPGWELPEVFFRNPHLPKQET